MYYYLILEITMYYYADAYYSGRWWDPKNLANPSQKPSKPSPKRPPKTLLKRLPKIIPRKQRITNWTQVSDTPSGTPSGSPSDTPSDSSASTPHRTPFLSSRTGG